jgi:hypothetical protein
MPVDLPDLRVLDFCAIGNWFLGTSEANQGTLEQPLQ